MPLNINTGRGKQVRDSVLSYYAAHLDVELTCKQLFDLIDEVEHRTDLADALSQMVKAGDLEHGEDRKPGEPGGMTGPGSRPVKTYRLKQGIQPDEPYISEIPDHDIDAETVTVDPLIAQLLEHEFKVPAVTSQDAQRLKALASTERFATELPDWSLYLHGLADRIAQIVDTRAV